MPPFLNMSKHFLEFTDSTHKIYWPVKLAGNMLHDSKTQLIQFTDQQNDWKLTDQMKKAKKIPENWKRTFHKGQYLKQWNINLASVSEHIRKTLRNVLTQLIQLNDQQI